MEEIWKKAKGLEERLLVSSKGRVFDILKNRLAKQFLSGRGYYSVTLWYGSKENRKNYIVSRLVAKAFIPNPNNLPQVNHKDENSRNNYFENLEWCTCKYNINYGDYLQRRSKSKSIAIDIYDANYNFIETLPSMKDVGEKYNISSSRISVACKNKKKTKGFYFKKHND